MYSGKQYNHQLIEKDFYKFWKDNDLFEPENKSEKQNFSIILPPPNVTGHLHLGHAWDGSIQDAIIRYKKLLGFNVCWFPGTDHAGISTQTKFDKICSENKWKFKNKNEYLSNLNKWVLEQKQYIHNQWAKMGFALAYKHERFTLDPDVNKLVIDTFIKLYERKLIYQNYKLVNWDVKLKTAISDIEVIYKKTDSTLYYFKYFIENSKEFIPIATTRPETMFGDICIFINPKDKRYRKYINKYVINPVNNERLKILTDDYIDQKFGTGAMKCTPAHDFNDYKLAINHKINNYHSIMNDDGTLNEYCKIDNKSFVGIDRLKARNDIVNTLKDKNAFIKEEKYVNDVGYSERTGEIIEPLLSNQWFVKMKPIVAEYRKHNKDNGNIFIPKRFDRVLNQWFDNIDDWCISRQLLWGHQLPVYHNKKNIYVGNNPPKGYERENMILDTWFSSGLWPLVFTINNNLKEFYPINTLVTAYDILFFWVARMLFQCSINTTKLPFKNIYIHGLVRDEQNRKMSKSLGNGIDPNDVIDKYGADALRLFLISQTANGEDLRFSFQKIEHMANFLNKIWNANNFLSQYEKVEFNLNKISLDINKWILNDFRIVAKKYHEMFTKYNFSVMTKLLIDFFWNIYCNNYLNLIAPILKSNNKSLVNETIYVAKFIYKQLIIMLHPFAPFVTENIYQLQDIRPCKSIMLESFDNIKLSCNKETITNANYLISIINTIRDIRIKNSIKNSIKFNINLITTNKNYDFLLKNYKNNNAFLNSHMINIENISKKHINQENEIVPINDGIIIEYDKSLINSSNKIENLLKKKVLLENEIVRSKNILSNKNFINKANPSKVKLEQDKYRKYLDEYSNLMKVINNEKKLQK